MSPPYSGASRRTPPPRITMACALRAASRSSGTEVSTVRPRRSATTGIDRASSAATPSAASVRPARGWRDHRPSPTTATSSGPVGGNTSALSSALSQSGSIIGGPWCRTVSRRARGVRNAARFRNVIVRRMVPIEPSNRAPARASLYGTDACLVSGFHFVAWRCGRRKAGTHSRALRLPMSRGRRAGKSTITADRNCSQHEL